MIVTDAGYKNPWFKSIEMLGWYWLGRVRGNVTFAGISYDNWQPVRSLHVQASSRAKLVGSCRLSKTRPIHCRRYLYKALPKGRKHQRSTTTNSHHPAAKEYSKAAKEPWVIATNLPETMLTAKQLMNLYRKRMQIEETFRDVKSPAYGFGFRHSRSRCPKRFDIMLLIALVLQLIFWWVGLFAKKSGWQKHFQANTVRSRNVLSLIRLGKEVLRCRQYRLKKRDIFWAIQEFSRRVQRHGCLLAEL